MTATREAFLIREKEERDIFALLIFGTAGELKKIKVKICEENAPQDM